MGSESEECCSAEEGVVLGVDGGTTNTVCVCLPLFPFSDHRQLPDPILILGRAAAGCSNYNSVGENAARETLEQVIKEALSRAGKNISAVRAICLGVSGVNHPSDQERVLNWIRNVFSDNVKIYVQNDAVVALASGTMGKLHGCVLIAGTGCIAYGFTEDGKEARAAGAGPVLGDWGSGYGIASRALTAVMKAHDGRGPATLLTNCIMQSLGLSSPDEIIGWTYADSSWARIAALAPLVVSCAEDGDQIADEILKNAVQELALSVKAVVQRLHLAGEDAQFTYMELSYVICDNCKVSKVIADGKGSFPVVMVGGVLEANKRWDIGDEVTNSIWEAYPGACPIRPKVEPAVGAALFAWSAIKNEAGGNGHR